VLKRTFLVVLFAGICRAATHYEISLVSLNMAKETDVGRIVREFRAIPALAQADVLLLQEVREVPGGGSAASGLASALGLHVAYSPAAEGVHDLGLAILSRHPIRDVRVRKLKPFNLVYRSRSRIALAATVDTPRGAIRVFNAHLDTRVNAADRLAQLEPIVLESAEFIGPRVVGGDFNTNAFYWIGRVLPLPGVQSQTARVEEFMRRKGFRTAAVPRRSTFDYLGMRLDWIWYQGLELRESRVYPLAFSDHHAVYARVQF
jgi:endonuclease/exonuclease/phosphatase family metal-dependent hydrolase